MAKFIENDNLWIPACAGMTKLHDYKVSDLVQIVQNVWPIAYIGTRRAKLLRCDI